MNLAPFCGQEIRFADAQTVLTKVHFGTMVLSMIQLLWVLDLLKMEMITTCLRPCLIQRVSDLLPLHELFRMLTNYSHRYPSTFHHCWMACQLPCCPRSFEVNGQYPPCQLPWSLWYAWTPHWALTIPQTSPRCNRADAFHSDSLVHQPKEEGRSACACLWYIHYWHLLYEGAHPSKSWPCHTKEAQIFQIQPNGTWHQP